MTETVTTGTIWLLVSTALVLFMTPGVAFFYGGLVRAKSVVSMLMLSFGSMGLVGVLWVLYGANMTSISEDASPWSFAGNPFSAFGLSGVSGEDLVSTVYGSTFAIITVALISGAIADRAKFGSWMIFAGLWATLSYFPVAAWVWGGGWIGTVVPEWFGVDGVLDFAGGTVVHINSGAAALALAIVLGRRIGLDKGIAKPHNVPLVLIGASVLWFGWFGFNGGAATDDATAGLIYLNTMVTPAAAILAWLVVEKIKTGKATAVGAGTGAVAGLVGITPACDQLTPGAAILLGLIVGGLCALAVNAKWVLGYDDSLDVVGVHLVGGLIGCIYLGFFANDSGLFYGYGWGQLGAQIVGSVPVAVYSFVIAFIIGKVIDKTIGFRVKNEDEVAGIDLRVHGESGYALQN
ncbi:ammonium transporter [Pseudoclavibacter sp. 13-3]|uniref:ammonium transporter n=1 Tax=Pseudoclavibacter sp. 13-3 TaxID=2901228 RepID=UPI001E29C0F6|nr:ammonium transporter [Pseudoclavibacter sp. 13-3]MCD7100480.1 ammonium transporter [Pseudoclavibacter sp. 13-3]